LVFVVLFLFFFSSRRRHTRSYGDWSSDVCSSDLFDAAHDRSGSLRLAEDLSRFKWTALPHIVSGALHRAEDLVSEFRSPGLAERSEERRVGKECRCGWSPSW